MLFFFFLIADVFFFSPLLLLRQPRPNTTSRKASLGISLDDDDDSLWKKKINQNLVAPSPRKVVFWVFFFAVLKRTSQNQAPPNRQRINHQPKCLSVWSGCCRFFRLLSKRKYQKKYQSSLLSRLQSEKQAFQFVKYVFNANGCILRVCLCVCVRVYGCETSSVGWNFTPSALKK